MSRDNRGYEPETPIEHTAKGNGTEWRSAYKSSHYPLEPF